MTNYSKLRTSTDVPRFGAGAAMIIYNKKGTTTTMYGGALYGFALYQVSGGVLTAIPDKEFFFPVSPKEISLTEPPAVNIQFTQDGKVVEHQGNVLKNLTVSGTTGFRPMQGQLPMIPDVVPVPTPDMTPGTFVVSPEVLTQSTGMQHFLTLRNIFREYYDAKGDPQRSNRTVMVWFNMKEGEYFVVEPIGNGFETRRSSASPFTFDYTINCQVLDFADGMGLTVVRDAIAWRIFANSLNPIQFISDIIDFGASLVRELQTVHSIISAVAGGISTSVLESVQGFQGSLQALVDGQDALSQFSAAEITVVGDDVATISTAMAVDTSDNPLVDSMDSEAYRNAQHTVSQTTKYLAKLFTVVVDSISKQKQTQDQAQYQQPGQVIEDSPYPALEQDIGSTPLSPDFAMQATAYTWDRVQSNEDIFRAAKRLMGSEGYWKVLVQANNLEPPYISKNGGVNQLAWGDIIRVPQYGGSPEANKFVQKDPLEEAGNIAVQNLNTLGTDIAVEYTVYGVETVVDLATNRSGDLETISGLPNMAQALNLKLLTERGALPMHPDYGLIKTVGSKGTISAAQQQSFAFKSTMLTDARVESVDSVSVVIDGDLISTKGKVTIRGVESPLTASFATQV